MKLGCIFCQILVYDARKLWGPSHSFLFQISFFLSRLRLCLFTIYCWCYFCSLFPRLSHACWCACWLCWSIIYCWCYFYFLFSRISQAWWCSCWLVSMSMYYYVDPMMMHTWWLSLTSHVKEWAILHGAADHDNKNLTIALSFINLLPHTRIPC